MAKLTQFSAGVGGHLLCYLRSTNSGRHFSVAIPYDFTLIPLSVDSLLSSDYQLHVSLAACMGSELEEDRLLIPALETVSTARFRSRYNLDQSVRLFSIYIVESVCILVSAQDSN
jgi:hypothetical protein